jgi:hypothetical protein
MLAAHIRTGLSQSTRSRKGEEPNPRAVSGGGRRQDICRPIWHPECVSSSADWGAARKTSGSDPHEVFSNLVSPESSLTTRPFVGSQHLADANYSYIYEPRHRSRSTPDRGAVFEQQLAAQQRQIESLQAALQQVQTCVVPFPGSSGVDCWEKRTGGSETYSTSVEHKGKKDERQAKETTDVQTQLSVNTNSSFFRVNPTGISVCVAAHCCGDNPVADPREGGACSQGPSPSTNQDSRRGPSHRPPHDPELPMHGVRVGCTDNAAVVSSRTRSGGVGGNGAISIFEEELVGQQEAGQGVHIRQALNMSYPGAGPPSVAMTAVPVCGMRVLQPDEKRYTPGIDGAVATEREDCNEWLAKDDEQCEGGPWQQGERGQGSAGSSAQRAPPHIESPAATHEAASVATAHDRGRLQSSSVQEKQEPECRSKSAVRLGLSISFLYFITCICAWSERVLLRTLELYFSLWCFVR